MPELKIDMETVYHIMNAAIERTLTIAIRAPFINDEEIGTFNEEIRIIHGYVDLLDRLSRNLQGL